MAKTVQKSIVLPVLALRGLMAFPHMVLHFDVGRAKSVAALEQAMMENQKVFLVCQKMKIQKSLLLITFALWVRWQSSSRS